jgi:diadenosine tetraphosphate (Ap4A) HIT family hydrolase
VTGCRKTYLAFFAEGEGFGHLHIHVIPRYDDQPPDRKGPAVFGYAAAPEGDSVPAAEMDRIGAALAERIQLA